MKKKVCVCVCVIWCSAVHCKRKKQKSLALHPSVPLLSESERTPYAVVQLQSVRLRVEEEEERRLAGLYDGPLNSRPRLYETYMTPKCAVKSVCTKPSGTSQSASSVCRPVVKIEHVALQKQTAAN